MTLQEFITTPPTNYGAGNVNLLVSSSVSGSEDIPIPPYTIQGLTVPFNSKNSKNVLSALKEVEAIRFQYTGGEKVVNVVSRQKKDGYFYIGTQPLVIGAIPDIDSLGEYVFYSAEFIFKPYFEISYFNNDYNPVINNTNESRTSYIRQVVDRVSSQAIPTNLTAVISQSAEPAQVQNDSYTRNSIIIGRYEGTKETDKNIPGNSPAVGLVSFKASEHPSDSDTSTIRNIQLSDREIQNLYFDSRISGSHPNKVFQSFPNSGSFIYKFDDQSNRYSKVSNTKIFSIEKNKVYTTNEYGGVTLVQ